MKSSVDQTCCNLICTLTKPLGDVHVTPVNLQVVLGLLASLHLIQGPLQGLGQGGLHLRDQLYLFQQLLLCCVLNQVVVNSPLHVTQAVPGNVERALGGLDGVLKLLFSTVSSSISAVRHKINTRVNTWIKLSKHFFHRISAD